MSSAWNGFGSIWRFAAKSGAGLYQYSPPRNWDPNVGGLYYTARVEFVPKFVDQVEVSPIESRAAGRIDVYRSFRRTIQSTLDDRVNSIFFGWAVAVTAVLVHLRPSHRYEGSGLRRLYVDWVACGGRAVG